MMIKFCTLCGSDINYKTTEGDSMKRAICITCNSIGYENPQIISGILRVQSGAILHLSDRSDYSLNPLFQEISKILRKDMSRAGHKDVHFWRYTKGTKHQEASILIDNNSKLAACKKSITQ